MLNCCVLVMLAANQCHPAHATDAPPTLVYTLLTAVTADTFLQSRSTRALRLATWQCSEMDTRLCRMQPRAQRGGLRGRECLPSPMNRHVQALAHRPARSHTCHPAVNTGLAWRGPTAPEQAADGIHAIRALQPETRPGSTCIMEQQAGEGNTAMIRLRSISWKTLPGCGRLLGRSSRRRQLAAWGWGAALTCGGC